MGFEPDIQTFKEIISGFCCIGKMHSAIGSLLLRSMVHETMTMYPHRNFNVPFFSLVYANIMSSPHTDVPLTFWWFELSTYGRVHRADDFAVAISFKFQTTIFFRFPQQHSSKLVIILRLCWSFSAPGALKGAHYLATGKLDVHTTSNMTYKVWRREPEVFLSSCL
ncbi:unnamed protein product [Miscanthus lutarioriparius]|uniref:Uncharacterized protein n=1 Tax=Miscanthus lutarioriparius TaxID=422564 RepID=A0A811MUP4_9POAL|nr:unnamed protein product [Miscanthus lutarioriparius]